MEAGTAGSLFGGCYYAVIALCSWCLGIMHDGTMLPLPSYIMLLAVAILLGAYLSQTQRGEAVSNSS